jgi:formylglycine-generating enzyme required for sulfatase activity
VTDPSREVRHFKWPTVTDIAVALKENGFVVSLAIDLAKASFIAKLREFAQAAEGAEIALFFYAGHGVQVFGQNYLVPIDAEFATESALNVELVPASMVYRAMDNGARFKIVFLDACRNNPLAEQLKAAMGSRATAVGRGLANTGSPGQDSLISFSTQPGNVALDGDGRNSPFVAALVSHLPSTMDLASMLQSVRAQVMTSTQQKQIPWEHSSLRVPIYLARETQPELSEAARAWEKVNKKSFPEIESFAMQFANAPEGERARLRIEKHWGCLTLKGRQDCVRIGGAGTGRDVRMPLPNFKDCALCPEMVIMPWGHFQVGSPDDEVGRDPGEVQVRVTIPYFFAVAQNLVSKHEWNACVAARGCRALQGVIAEPRQGSDPVLDATPDDARSYAMWLSTRTGRSYRMLSEAEWEISARAGTTTAYWWGPTLDARPSANVINPWGFRLAGAEWVDDCWNATLVGIPSDGRARVTGDCTQHVVRGSNDDRAASLRSAYRGSAVPGTKGIGFRLVSTLVDR